MKPAPLQPLPIIGVQVRVGVQGKAFLEGAPRLLAGRAQDIQFQPAQPLLQGMRLVCLLRVIGPLRGESPSVFQEAQHPLAHYPQQSFYL